MIPCLHLPTIYDLLARLRDARHPAPVVTVRGLRLNWEPCGECGGVVTVFDDNDPPEASARCTIYKGGLSGVAARCGPVVPISLRNLAADPRRWIRREGQETGYCPLCRKDIVDCDLAAMIGYCRSCAGVLCWPHGERAARNAEDALRHEIQAEQKAEEHL